MGVSHVAIQFPLYEYMKVQLAARGGGRRSPEHLSIGVRLRAAILLQTLVPVLVVTASGTFI